MTLAESVRATACCDSCAAPNGKTVLRQYGWWTDVSLEATVWALNGRFSYEPGTRRESNGALIETIPECQFIHLPWRHASEDGKPFEHRACFPNTRQHRWVTIRLTLYEGRSLCQWCRFKADPRFSRHTEAALARLGEG
jgi:hypothetical protein